MKTTAVYTASHEYLIPADCLRDICNPGRNELAVQAWVYRMDWDQVTPDTIRAELLETGGWSTDELRDDEQNRVRFLWVLAWNAYDAEVEEDEQCMVRRLVK